MESMPDAGQEPVSYKIKRISFLGRTDVPIFCQGNNGPCPLLCIGNVLSLRNMLDPGLLSSGATSITNSRLISIVAELILDSTPAAQEGATPRAPSGMAELEANLRANIDDCLKVLGKLATGVDVNIKFDSCSAFEPTSETAVFDLLGITLLHGWLVDPADEHTFSVMGHRSYNETVELVVQSMDEMVRTGSSVTAGHGPSPLTQPPSQQAIASAPDESVLDMSGLEAQIPDAQMAPGSLGIIYQMVESQQGLPADSPRLHHDIQTEVDDLFSGLQLSVGFKLLSDCKQGSGTPAAPPTVAARSTTLRAPVVASHPTMLKAPAIGDDPYPVVLSASHSLPDAYRTPPSFAAQRPPGPPSAQLPSAFAQAPPAAPAPPPPSPPPPARPGSPTSKGGAATGVAAHQRAALAARAQHKMAEAMVTREFLEAHASQLTVYGISDILDTLQDNATAAFFRNCHFNVLHKHDNALYLLVTDQGYLGVREVVWERLDTVDGDTQLCDADFRPYKAPARQPTARAVNMEALAALTPEAMAGLSEQDAAAIAEAAGVMLPPPLPSEPSAQTHAQHGSQVAGSYQPPPLVDTQASSGWQPGQQQGHMSGNSAHGTHGDADLALAMQLQQEEEDQAARADAQRAQHDASQHQQAVRDQQTRGSSQAQYDQARAAREGQQLPAQRAHEQQLPAQRGQQYQQGSPGAHSVRAVRPPPSSPPTEKEKSCSIM